MADTDISTTTMTTTTPTIISSTSSPPSSSPPAESLHLLNNSNELTGSSSLTSLLPHLGDPGEILSMTMAKKSESKDRTLALPLVEKLQRENKKQKGSAISMKKVNEAVAAWSGVDLVPFPGIPIHDCKEKIIEDKLSEWLGTEVEDAAMASEPVSPDSPRSPRVGKKSGNFSPSSPKSSSGTGSGATSPKLGHSSGTKSPTQQPGPKDIKQRHAEIESKVAMWAGLPEEILADPKNPQSSAVAFPGIRLHVIKDKEDRLHEIEENVAAWAGVDGPATPE